MESVAAEQRPVVTKAGVSLSNGTRASKINRTADIVYTKYFTPHFISIYDTVEF
jgi:hypothetical protein